MAFQFDPNVYTYPAVRRWLGIAFLHAAVFVLAISVAFLVDNQNVAAQSSDSDLRVSRFETTQSGVGAETASYQGAVTITNPGDADFAGVERVDYQIDGGEKQLVYIVTSLAAGASSTITFNFELTPGDHTVAALIGESLLSVDISVDSADIAVEIDAHRLKRGKIVEFDLIVSNHGVLAADDVILVGSWISSDDEPSQERTMRRELVRIELNQDTLLTLPIELAAGSYDFEFEASTSTLEGEKSNNSATLSLDVEFADLRITVESAESLGWDDGGRALMSIFINVENAGFDDSNPFNVGFKCINEETSDCSRSTQFQSVPAGDEKTAEIRVWLPTGEQDVRLYAAEDEDSFLWGYFNAIDHAIDVPTAPDLVWDLRGVATPEVSSYWSDGSANVDLDLTFVNNGTYFAQNIAIGCFDDNVVVEDCGAQFSVEMEPDVYPTVISQTLRLPRGDTDLLIVYGADSPKSVTVNVPERILGVERDVWECFTDTSFVADAGEDGTEGEGTHVKDELGIGCGGWDETYIKKWPIDETISVWVTGETSYVDIFKDVLSDLGPFLNLEFEYVSTKSDAHLVAYSGWPKEDAASTSLDCTGLTLSGCAQNLWNDDGEITASLIAIWVKNNDDEEWRNNDIHATTLHELLHALTGVNHRHHDRTSVMSYEALEYTMIDGMDRGLFQLLAHPLVKPGMSFDDVLDLIIFSDELNDPPESENLSAKQLLRRAHAAWMDAGSVRYEVKGAWPDCNVQYGWSRYELSNLRPRLPFWQYFEHGNFRYHFIHHPSQWGAYEFWLKRGREWRNVDSSKVFKNTYFRTGFTNPFIMLSNINIYASDVDYTVVSENANRVVLEVTLDDPNPSWSRKLELLIRIEVHPETFHISNYKMNWQFTPREQRTCGSYVMEARNPVYGEEFIFPDEIREGSSLLD